MRQAHAPWSSTQVQVRSSHFAPCSSFLGDQSTGIHHRLPGQAIELLQTITLRLLRFMSASTSNNTQIASEHYSYRVVRWLSSFFFLFLDFVRNSLNTKPLRLVIFLVNQENEIFLDTALPGSILEV
jgi:hypothetical protein